MMATRWLGCYSEYSGTAGNVLISVRFLHLRHTMIYSVQPPVVHHGWRGGLLVGGLSCAIHGFMDNKITILDCTNCRILISTAQNCVSQLLRHATISLEEG